MTASEALRRRLQRADQLHVLRFWNELDAASQERLASQILSIDLDQVKRLSEKTEVQSDYGELAARATPPPAIRCHSSDNRFRRAEAREAGQAELRAGHVAALLVAGGQGTRLGFPHPKGMFPIGPVSQRTLFQIYIDQLIAMSEKYAARIPLFLMTSPATHDETVAYFDEHDRFGFPADDLHIFCQGTMPAVDEQGKLLLAAKDQLALSPDGHGGTLAAFQQSGCMATAKNAGIRHLFYFQVDNPLVSIADPELIGYHCLAQSEMTTQVVAKQDPAEKVGNVVSVDGRLRVIEYSDLPDEAARRVDDQGQPIFWAGNIAVHVIDVAFFQRAADTPEVLPFHIAHKKVPFVNQDGKRVEPAAPNAIKFERFIFDLIPEAENAIVVEGEAEEVFAPVKNASGADKDSPETAQAAILRRAKRWLTQAGIDVAEGVQVEIHPRVATEPDDLKELEPKAPIREDTFLR